MKFGPASPVDAIGGVTVHTLRQGALVLKKGTTIGPAEVVALSRAGVAEIVVVRLEKGDVSEDVAAAGIALALVLWLAAAPVAALFASRASLRDESTLAVLAVMGGVVYCGMVLTLFGKQWIAAFRRRRAPAKPLS